MGHRYSLTSDEKGVSTVVAVTLLVGLTLVGVIVIFVVGFGSIAETSREADLEVAEETMLQIDSTLEQDVDGNTTVSFPDDLNGQVNVSNDQTYNLTLDSNPECSTGSRPLSSVEYEENGQTVAYEGGGVFRMTESGATMVSPPDVSYDRGSLSVSFVEMEGEITSTGELQMTTNASRQRNHQNRLGLALYTDASYSGSSTSVDTICQPEEVENATLRIEDSQYASAWARWARDNHNSSLVTVEPAGSVSPGDTVSITYPLGGVSDTYYEVTDLEVTRASASDQPEVNATVTNTGGLRPDSPIDVDLSYGGSQIASESISLGEDESTRVSYTLSDSDINNAPADSTVEVSSPNETASGELEFTSAPDGTPETVVSNDGVPSDAGEGSTPPGAAVEITNTGDMTAYETITMYVDGTPQNTYDVVVAPGDTERWEVGDQLPTNELGSYNVSFRGEYESSLNTEINPFEVGSQGYLDATITNLPEDMSEDDTVTLEADIENTGQRSSDGVVTLEVVDESTGSSVAPADPPKQVDVNLGGSASDSGSESTTVSLDYTANDGVGNYEYIVDTGYKTVSGAFSVGVDPKPNFIVREASITENPVVQGPENTTTFEVKVANTGQRRDDQIITLENSSTGDVVESRTETLDPGEEVSFEWTVDSTEFDIGDNRVSVTTENTSVERNLQVLDSEPTVTDDGSTITVTERSDVRITMLGAELEDHLYNPNTVTADEGAYPTEMTLVIDEPSSSQEERILWDGISQSGANVNHPVAERRMNQGNNNMYTESLSVEPGTDLSLFATSYDCPDRNYGEWDDPIYLFDFEDNIETSVEHTRTYDGNDYTITGHTCNYNRYQSEESPGDRLIRISQDSNSQNVVINESGEDVPSFEQASGFQLSLEQMLGNERIDNGELELATDERIFLYELSQPDASPGNADKSGDPDYNDAAALFQVTSIDREIERLDFVITEQDAPSDLTEGDDAQVELTVGNDGTVAGQTDVEFTFDGDTQTKSTGELDPGEEETLTFDISSDTAGTYEWQGNAVKTDGAERSGFVTFGTTVESNFVVSSFSGDSVADTDGSPEADVTVRNDGDSTDSQDIRLEVRNDDAGGGFSTSDTVNMNLDPGDSESVTFDLPTGQANYTYRVATDDTETSERDLFVGRSNVIVDPAEDQGINIGTEEWGQGELIQRNGSIYSMNVNLRNVGNVGDERDVQLTIEDADSGSTVFEDTNESVGVPGSGISLTGSSGVSASGQAEFDFDSGSNPASGGTIDPGYYEYTVTIYNDTQAGGDVENRVTGEILLEEVSDTSADTDDSPVSVDSGTITVG